MIIKQEDWLTCRNRLVKLDNGKGLQASGSWKSPVLLYLFDRIFH